MESSRQKGVRCKAVGEDEAAEAELTEALGLVREFGFPP